MNVQGNVATTESIGRMELVVANEMMAVHAAADQITADLELQGVAMRFVFQIRMALEEALANAVKHGNRLDPSKRVKICYSVVGGRVEITIEDQGNGFDVEEVADPTDEANLCKPGGRGLLMMRSFMTEIRFNDVGNAVTLVKDTVE